MLQVTGFWANDQLSLPLSGAVRQTAMLYAAELCNLSPTVTTLGPEAGMDGGHRACFGRCSIPEPFLFLKWGERPHLRLAASAARRPDGTSMQ